MNIKLKNKFLYFDNYKLRCAIGKRVITDSKKEGDQKTPKGTFKFKSIFYRKDKLSSFKSFIRKRMIKKNMGWCDDPRSKHYNKEIKIDQRIRHEKLFRNDNIYDYFIVINYNTKKIIPYKGSAIFLHLTNNYKPTNGCVAIKRNDFEVLLKLINKKTKIKIT